MTTILSLSATIVYAYTITHRRILDLADRLTDEQIHWRLAPTSLPIAFHLWHIARWTDYTQAAFPGMTPELGGLLPPGVQIWEAEHLAQKWGFTPELGFAGTGMQMDEATAARLAYPPKEQLLDYLRRSLAAADQSAAVIPEDQLAAAEQLQPLTEGIWGEGTVGGSILEHVVHDNRHLGAIESLLGLQTGKGTASV